MNDKIKKVVVWRIISTIVATIVSYIYLGEIKNETFLNEKAKEWGIDPKQDLWRMPAGYVGFYAEQDAGLTLRLWQRFKAEIQQQSLNDVWEMEMALLPILIEMRSRGIRVNEEKAQLLKKEFIQKENKLLKKIKDETTPVSYTHLRAHET